MRRNFLKYDILCVSIVVALELLDSSDLLDFIIGYKHQENEVDVQAQDGIEMQQMTGQDHQPNEYCESIVSRSHEQERTTEMNESLNEDDTEIQFLSSVEEHISVQETSNQNEKILEGSSIKRIDMVYLICGTAAILGILLFPYTPLLTGYQTRAYFSIKRPLFVSLLRATELTQ